MELEEQRAWLGQWQAAGAALQQQKALELKSLGDDEARRATATLLSLAGQIHRDPARWGTSGLVEQQRWFQKLRSK